MKSLYKISIKIAKELICKNTQFNYFDEKTRDRLNLVAKSIISDYDYIYDPDHVLNPGGEHQNNLKKL